MKVLAIESASTVASIALVENDKVICEYTINDKKTHSQTIMPMIEAMKQQLNLDLKTLDGIAVSGGPGSYTGLRIGSATAKGLAHVLDIPVIGVSTLESLAYNIQATEAIICPMLDARRQHVFAGAYHYVEGEIVNLIPIDQYSVEALLGTIKSMNRQVIFLGDGYSAYFKLIESLIAKTQILVARPSDFIQRATNIGLIAIKSLEKGEYEDYLTHQPQYYRITQAEREYEEKQSGRS